MNLNNKNIPNLISIFRILLVPVIFILIILSFVNKISIQSVKFSINIHSINYIYKMPITFLIAGILFLLAIFSDFLDGYIARKYNSVSDQGKLLDAIADKILVNSILIGFLYEKIVPVYVVFILIIRDFCMDALRLFLSTKHNTVLAASKLGKYKTIFVMIGLLLIFIINPRLVHINDNNLGMYSWFNQVMLIILYIGTALSFISAKVYFISNIKLILNKDNTKEEENVNIE